MNSPRLSLTLQRARHAVCRLAPGAPVPDWATGPGTFTSVTRTPEELSILCPEAQVPASVQQERGLRLFKVAGPLDFSLVGILDALAHPMAQAGVSIFAVSTFDTDYLLVSEARLDRAIAVLEQAGHHLAIE